MKHIKLALIISMLGLCQGADAQVFRDGMVQVNRIVSRTLDEPPAWNVRDSVLLDSTDNDTFYYSVDRKVLRTNRDEDGIWKQIKLKEIENRVYASATNSYDTLTKVLIYDFNLGPGDSLIVRSGDVTIKINQIDTFILQNGDSLFRQVVSSEQTYLDGSYFAKDIGSTLGIIGVLDLLSLTNLRDGRSTLLTACVSETVLYQYESDASFNDWCTPEEVVKRVANVKNEDTRTISIYPNPATTEIRVESLYTNAHYTIFNTSGALVDEGIMLDKSIMIKELSPGLYYLMINNDKEYYQATFVKE